MSDALSFSVILLDGQVPIKYGLRLNSESKYIDFKKELSKLCNLDAGLMLVCELSNSQIRCALPDDQRLKVSSATELFVYEIPKSDFYRQRTSTDIGISIENGLKDIQRNQGMLVSVICSSIPFIFLFYLICLCSRFPYVTIRAFRSLF